MFFHIQTQKWSGTSVLHHVYFGVGFLDKIFITEIAPVWPIVRVKHHVLLQCSTSSKSFPTLVTKMFLRVGFLYKSFITEIAPVWPIVKSEASCAFSVFH